MSIPAYFHSIKYLQSTQLPEKSVILKNIAESVF